MLCARAKFDRLDVQKEYDKRQSTGKDNINLVVIGELCHCCYRCALCSHNAEPSRLCCHDDKIRRSSTFI